MLEWVTKNDRHIPYEELSDNHLRNILRLLVKNATVRRSASLQVYCTGPEPRGDMAQFYFDQEFDYVLETSWEDFVHPKFEGLLHEAKGRDMELDLDLLEYGNEMQGRAEIASMAMLMEDKEVANQNE